MVVIGLAIIGAVFGALAARKQKGNVLDMLQYGAGYAFAFAIVGLILTLVIDRSV